MAHPARNACPETILSSGRVFFATTKTSMARRLLQSERNAMLLIDVLRSNVAAGKFQLHDFVIMPDHLHLLMTLPGDISIEKAMQLIKGGFSQKRNSKLFAASRIYYSEPRQRRTRCNCRAVPLQLHLPGNEKGPVAKALIAVPYPNSPTKVVPGYKT
jgi:REP element-mobilizing transposase RayT